MAKNEAETILNLVNLYALAIDTLQWDLFDEVFTDDVIADYGEGAVWTGLATFKQVFAVIHAVYSGTQHTMTNTVWDFRSNEAFAVTYGHFRLIKPGTPGGDFWEGQGYYDDRLVKVHGKWRIQHRISRITWAGGNPVVLQTTPGQEVVVPITSLHQVAAAGNLRFLNERHPDN
ncbi:nuclear transport factor 2 family protein [Nannocystis radixulma]|uniref:Nuclear transport factor 2 family protein n=1 Tax=Nannocystis radixulma TaxID=2995305 RepID=A0ABT5BEJ8_9BACT|nr:nuclear transport factor 2 family protein [Nannocystis radixulma]MDC0672571.1 nuclear transport factor 2 family protein [Nannocystis radixulma]